MAEAAANVPVKAEKKTTKPTSLQASQPFEDLRRQVNRLFNEFGDGFWRLPFRRSVLDVEPLWQREWDVAPAVDIVEKDNAYEVTTELPGLDEKDVEVKLADGNLTIKGEKEEEKEEKKKDYYLRERHFGAFERTFRVPTGVDVDKVEASFKKGVLTVTLPKSPEAQKAVKKIAVKGA
jgi:HSP20 family protein